MRNGPAGSASGAARGNGASADPLPVSVWDLPERGTRGPKARHDRLAIASAAVRIADARGLDGLTMRQVADELGIATMSLYNYVAAKDHLVQLIIDKIAGEYAFPPHPPADRRAAVAELARQSRAIAQRHPWLGSVMQRPGPPGPSGLRYLDYFLGLLDQSRLDTGAKFEIIAVISGFATMYGATQGSLLRQHTSAGREAEMQVQAFIRAAASGHYPNLAAALAVAGPPRGEDAVFESCIQRLIDVAMPGSRR